MKQIGWFVVGHYYGKFGSYLFESVADNKSPIFIEDESGIQYWKNRGYEVIPAYVEDKDAEEYTYRGEDV